MSAHTLSSFFSSKLSLPALALFILRRQQLGSHSMLRPGGGSDAAEVRPWGESGENDNREDGESDSSTACSPSLGAALTPAAETKIGEDEPSAPPLPGSADSQGDRLDKSSFEERVKMVRSMTVQELIEFLHHDATPDLETADDRKKALMESEGGKQSVDHLHLVRVILRTLREMIEDQDDIDPYILSLAPL